MNNQSLESQTCEVSQRLLDANGNEVAKCSGASVSLQPKETLGCKQQMTLENPHLWSTADPYLYKVETMVKVEGKVIDVYETTTGIRDIAFDADKGFLLNGKLRIMQVWVLLCLRL